MTEFARVAGDDKHWYVQVGDRLEIKADDREDAETMKNLLNYEAEALVKAAVEKEREICADLVETMEIKSPERFTMKEKLRVFDCLIQAAKAIRALPNAPTEGKP